MKTFYFLVNIITYMPGVSAYRFRQFEPEEGGGPGRVWRFVLLEGHIMIIRIDLNKKFKIAKIP